MFSYDFTSGDVIRLGRRHVFRFNHPGEAAKLREQIQCVSDLLFRVEKIRSNKGNCAFIIK